VGLPKQQTENMLRWGRRTKWGMFIASACLLILVLFDNDNFPNLLFYPIFAIGFCASFITAICGFMYRREQERAPLL
jgi:hypothetical protein